MGFIWLNSKLGVPVNQEYENLQTNYIVVGWTLCLGEVIGNLSWRGDQFKSIQVTWLLAIVLLDLLMYYR
jgi:hypothetical protein